MGRDDEQHETPSEPTWQVEVDTNKCSLCEVCGHRCPTGAIRSEQTEDTLAILFNHRLCDGCRDCLNSCPEEAMALAVSGTPTDAPADEVLATSEMLLCSVCGTRFAPQAKLEAAAHRCGDDTGFIRDQCPLCRRTQMVARFIEEKRKTQGRKAEYRTGKKWRWKRVEPGDPDAPPCPEVTPATRGQDTPDEKAADAS